jgi:acyl transferase domain-containing protein/NADPH:quinone reductase-like Zn-dependent oxidoreductase/SAM-dependent methyltransferase
MSREREVSESLSPLKRAYLAVERLQARVATLEGRASEPVAVIGLGCRFPGAPDPDAFWELLRDGADAIREVPEDRWDLKELYDPDPGVPGKMSTRFGGFLERIDEFDAAFFGIAPREATRIDPQQRLLLEVAWEALEHAGLSPPRLEGSSTSVFVGVSTNDYTLLQAHRNLRLDLDPHYASGAAGSVVSGRVSYVLGLAGPSITLDTACSSSLVAVHLACQSLRTGECDAALAGGVNVIVLPDNTIAFSSSAMMAPDGRCKTFDASADGFVRGEGCGIVVLKRLSDAQAAGNRILAVIRGSAVNQDGASSGLTVPNGPSQVAVVRRALQVAGVSPSDLQYVEAHGTGTSLGDPVEVRALGEVFRQGRSSDQKLWLGSVKTNLGHLEASAGVCGLIKVVLSLKHGVIPASLHFREPNPHIAWAEFPFLEVAKESVAWEPKGKRLAGVSSFGFSGTNAHVVVEGAPEQEIDGPSGPDRSGHVLALSARTEQSLRELAGAYAASLKGGSTHSLADICHTAGAGRAHFSHRLSVVASSTEEAERGLEAYLAGRASSAVATGVRQRGDGPRVAFLFTGQGSQYVGMGQELYETQPTFRRVLQECGDLLGPRLGPSLVDILYKDGGEGRVNQTAYTQPLLFSLEYALAEMWRSWGVQPSVMLGHSIGEYVAACIAGVFSLEQALNLVAARGQLMQAVPGSGGMAVVFAPESDVSGLVEPWADRVTVAAVNGPHNTVISGDQAALEEALAALEKSGLSWKGLVVSHGFHSPQMDPMLEAFGKAAGEVTYEEPRIGFVSNITGEIATPGEVTKADYWVRHVRSAVRFRQGMETLASRGAKVFLEVGPHATLLGLGQECVEGEPRVWLPTLRRGRSDWEQVLKTLSQLYVEGVDVDWRGFDGDYQRRITSLPTYRFQRKRFWLPPVLESERGAGARPGIVVSGNDHPLLGEEIRSPLVLEVIFRATFDAESLPYLADHRVFGTPILPGAAFLEMTLSAARRLIGDGPCVVEDLVLQQALTLDEGRTPTVQVVASPEGGEESWFLQVISRVAGDPAEPASWTTHAVARVRKGDGRSGSRWSPSVGDLEARCAEALSVEELYDAIEARGIHLGPSFRGIVRGSRGEGEATARIRLPESLATSLSRYAIHPVLLDMGFQTGSCLLLSRSEDSKSVFLPVGVDSAVIHRPPGSELTSQVRLRPGDGDGVGSLALDVRLLDGDDDLVAEVRGLRLKRVEAATLPWAVRDRISDWVYEVQWRPGPVPEVVEPAGDAQDHAIPALRPAALAGEAEELAREHGLEAYGRLLPEVDSLVAAFVVRALCGLGWKANVGDVVDPEQLAKALGVVPEHQRLWRRLVALLVEQGVLARGEGGAYRVGSLPPTEGLEVRIRDLLERHPEGEAELTLVGRAGKRLGECLCGRDEPLEVLFPGGSFDTADLLYRRSPPARVYNSLVRQVVRQLVSGWPAGRPLRVLEIGAGTGGTTSFILPEMPADRTHYVYTDLSPLFLSKAKERFADYGFLEYRALDIETCPRAQGLRGGMFDLVVAANVLHATSDLRQTLQNVKTQLVPGGRVVLLEGMKAQSWIDVTFGMTDGWWAFKDTDVRPSYPLLDRNGWRALLEEAGFLDCVSVPGEDSAGVLRDHAVLVARAPETVVSQTPSAGGIRSWLVFSDAAGAGRALGEHLRRQGDRVVEVTRGEGFARLGHDRYALDPTAPQDYTKLTKDLLSSDGSLPGGTLHLWSLDDQPAAEPTADELSAAQDRGCRSLLHLVQAFATVGHGDTRIWIVTRGAQAVAGEMSSTVHAPLWGLARVIDLEHPEFETTLVDLDTMAAGHDVDVLATELRAQDVQPMVAHRGGLRYVARLARAPLRKSDQRSGTSVPPETLVCRTPGVLDSLAFSPVRVPEPQAGEVQIRVHATGLNFRDVLIALGVYPDPEAPIGGECVGDIVQVGAGVDSCRVGDRIMAMAPGAFGSVVNAKAELVAHVPAGLTASAACTIPSAFVTAKHALTHLARLVQGDRVLIHAGAGGVGQAAVQLARSAGAEIYATAGSPGKRDHLRAQGVEHVMDSRTLDFVDEVRAATDGEGVDVVLNSLADEFVPASFSVLGKGGRFIELGKRGVWSPERAHEERPDADYHLVDLAAVGAESPETVGRLLESVRADLAAGEIEPLPHHVFESDAIGEAFHFMARARHIGKIVVKRPVPEAEASRYLTKGIRSEGTYLITGGAGGLGLEVARWLVDGGARHLALLGRTEPGGVAAEAIQELGDLNADVRFFRADVSSRDQLAGALDTIAAEMPQLCGVVHAAGVLRDGVLLNQTWSGFSEVMAPKVQGAWNLHQLTREATLDFFILFSSISSVMGSPGQGNHAAANAFLDVLAHARRRMGLPAQSINWGVWSEVGAAAEHGVGDRMEVQGMGSMSPDEGIQALSLFMQGDRPQGAIMPVDWGRFLPGVAERSRTTFFSELAVDIAESDATSVTQTGIVQELSALTEARRLPRLSEWIREQARCVLGLDEVTAVPMDQPLQEIGLDSLMAVELKNLLRTGLELEGSLPATLVFDHPTVEALSSHVAFEVLAWEQGPRGDSHGAEGDDELDAVSGVEALSDEEVAQRLRDRASKTGEVRS